MTVTAEEAQQTDAAQTEAPTAGRGAKPTKPRAPKPTTSYITANTDWDPVTDRYYGQETSPSQTEARHTLKYATIVGRPKMILRVITTYEYVEDNLAELEGGSDDG